MSQNKYSNDLFRKKCNIKKFKKFYMTHSKFVEKVNKMFYTELQIMHRTVRTLLRLYLIQLSFEKVAHTRTMRELMAT